MTGQQPEASVLGDVVLAWLLTAGAKGGTPVQLRKGVEPLFRHRWEGALLADRLDRALDHLDAAGLIARGKGRAGRLTLAPEGLRRGLDVLGLDELPPRTTWAKLKKTFLLARALGLPAPAGEGLKRFALDTGFKAALLKSRYALPTADYPTLPQATDALAWKLIGFNSTEPFNARNVQRALFHRELGGHHRADPGKAVGAILSRAVGARRDAASELREAALRGWVDRTSAGPAPSGPADGPAGVTPFDLDAFSRRVLLAARSSPTGRFGDNKVFIAHIWRAVRDDPQFRGMELDGFKRHLNEANQARLLDLGRADLVEAMDPADVAASETRHLGATYHFVRI